MMKNIQHVAAILGITALVVFGLSSCGTEDNSVSKHVVPIKMNVDTKTVFVDRFLNLTDNDDLNIFEEGVPEMLEESLINITNVNVVPRLSVRTFMAVNEDESRESVLEAARAKGAQYLIDGIIVVSRKNNYKIHANLIDLRSGENEKIQEDFAVAEFNDRNDALPKLNQFIEDVSAKLSKSRAELKKLQDFKIVDYDLFRKRMLAISSYNRGRIDVSISLMEQAYRELKSEKPQPTAEGEHEKQENRIGVTHFILAQLYTETGDTEKALKHLRPIKDWAENNPEENWVPLVLGMWHENHDRYKEAESYYNDLISEFAHESSVHLRLAAVQWKQGNRVQAMKTLEKGLQSAPRSSVIQRQIAEYRMQQNEIRGEEQRAEAERLPNLESRVATEVVSALINEQVESEFVKRNPTLMPLILKVENGSGKQIMRIGDVTLDEAQLEKAVDYSCPETTDQVVRMANIAVRSGNQEFAHHIAELIRKHGTAPNSTDAYHTIIAMVKTSEGDFEEAKKHAIRISKMEPARYIAIGNLLMHMGHHEKAAEVMEKALKLNSEPHPLLYYNIANAHLLAGHYKKWHHFNEKFISVSSEMGLISEKYQEQIRLARADRERLPGRR